MQCGDATSNIIVASGGSNKAWEVEAGETTGTTYHVVWISARFFAGEQSTEPATAPLFVFEQ